MQSAYLVEWLLHVNSTGLQKGKAPEELIAVSSNVNTVRLISDHF